MVYIKQEPLSESEYMSYMSSIPSTSTIFPKYHSNCIYHNGLSLKVEGNFENLHLNVQNEPETFEDDYQKDTYDRFSPKYHNNYHDELSLKVEGNFEKLHLNVQNEPKTFERSEERR